MANTSLFHSIVRRFYVKVWENSASIGLTVYFLLLLANYAYYGLLFQFTLGLWFIAAIPIVLLISRSAQLVKETSPFIILLLSYEALQGFASVLSSASSILLVFPVGTFNLVNAVQIMFYSAQVTRAATFLYGLHFPLVIVSALLLWYTNKILYRRYTYSMIACSYICLLVYIIAPSAPPWYTGAAIDLLHVQATTTATTATAAVAVDPGPIAPSLWTTLVNVGGLFESDKFAAFPSLHAAYAALFCYFTLKARRVYGIIAVPVTIGILFSTIYLGQHFLIDLVAGVGLAVSCALLVSKCSTARTGLKNSNTIKTESRLVRNMKKEEVLLC